MQPSKVLRQFGGGWAAMSGNFTV